MKNLIKYEFRKNLFSKLIFLGITAVMEACYLIGIFGEFEKLILIGMLGLFFTALAGITYIGIESILILYRDLTTKQSYMLFMTPNSSYKILGAKVIENAFSILIGGAFFGALAALDFTILLRENLSVEQIVSTLRDILESIDPRLVLSAKTLLILLLVLLCSWLLRIGTAYLAIVVSCTLLSGRKGAGFISFVLYIAINILLGIGMDKLPEPGGVDSALLLMSAEALALSTVSYVVSAWIMDKKLSV